jgi:hypothetical protein
MATGPRLGIDCPHCQEKVRVRSSRVETSTSKAISLQCSNIDCGATYGGVIEITHQILASAVANPEIHLRTVAPRQRQLPANDNGAGAPVVQPIARGPGVPPLLVANDDDDLSEAIGFGG